MKPVWITDTAVITPLGTGVEETWQRLNAGESAIRPLGHFDTGDYVSDLAACIGHLPTENDGPSRFNTLLDQLLESTGPIPRDAALITASTKGGIDALEDALRGVTRQDPGRFFDDFLGHIVRRLGLVQGGFNVNAACASATIAIGHAAAMIAAGAARCAVVLCLDVVSEFVFSGFSALKALSPGPSRPFDQGRCGLSLGEGAAALLLMAPDAAKEEGRAPLGAILGWGAAADAFHITAPAMDGSGLVETIRRTLKKAGMTPHEISAISAHGTGTVFNDAMELTAFDQVFGSRQLPMNSIKGAIGHTLGAAGGIEAVLALKALAEQTLPPTAGLVRPEAAANGNFSDRPQTFPGDVLLSTNSGFGGINGALLFGKAVTA
jgi:3-oxoacyl-[acyl-carrier-protein] synthase II